MKEKTGLPVRQAFGVAILTAVFVKFANTISDLADAIDQGDWTFVALICSWVAIGIWIGVAIGWVEDEPR